MKNDLIIEVKVNNWKFKKLDLDKKQAITIEYVSNLLSSIEDITCSSSYTIKIPHTVNNDEIMQLAKVPSFDSGQLYKKIDCRVYVNGFDITGKAWCYITDSDADTYSLVIVFGLMQDFETWLFNKPSLRDLDPNSSSVSQGTTDTDKITWNANSGVTIWESDFYSKYDEEKRSMYFGTYERGVNNVNLCNIHPWVSLREIWERILSENGINITAPGKILDTMEDIGLLLTSNNTKNLSSQDATIYSAGLQRIGWITNKVEYFAMRFTEGEYYHNVTPRPGEQFSPTDYTTPAKWNEFGFLHKGAGSVSIHQAQYGRIYVGGWDYDGEGNIVYLNGTTKYSDYFNNHEVSDMLMYYPLSNGTYQMVSAQRDEQHPHVGVYFDIPTINADGSRPIIGSLVFSFIYIVGGKQVYFKQQQILTSYNPPTNANESIPFTYTYKANASAYNPTNGFFNLVENLPDITQIDFVKAVCHMFGLFCVSNSGGGVELVNFSTLTKNATAGNCYDWSGKLIDTGRPNPHKIGYTINNYARQNSFGYKPDENDPVPHDSMAYLIVENETLEKLKKLVEFPWAATTISGFNASPLVEQYIATGDNEVDFRELEYRLLQADGVTGRSLSRQDESNGVIGSSSRQEQTSTNGISLSFPKWLEAGALLEANYSEYQEAIRKPKVITEKIRLDEYELKTLDFTKPVYLQKHGRYFAIMSVRWSSQNDASEVKMLML